MWLKETPNLNLSYVLFSLKIHPLSHTFQETLVWRLKIIFKSLARLSCVTVSLRSMKIHLSRMKLGFWTWVDLTTSWWCLLTLHKRGRVEVSSVDTKTNVLKWKGHPFQSVTHQGGKEGTFMGKRCTLRRQGRSFGAKRDIWLSGRCGGRFILMCVRFSWLLITAK